MTRSVLAVGVPEVKKGKLCLHEACVPVQDELSFPILEIGMPVSVTCLLMGLI